MNQPSSPFDFDEWTTLAKTDPEAFARRRREAIEKLIASAPPTRQQRLRGLQWSIDAELQTCRTPLQACMRIFDRMWDSVYGAHGLLDALKALGNPPLFPVPENQSSKPAESAKVLPFKRTEPVI
ncbi:MAG: DUF3135 domain-containing protein [Gammaproteobacteria bacterium]|nr:DUF3135 domain-containing protein [Gammaproteobacteria bacterium]